MTNKITNELKPFVGPWQHQMFRTRKMSRVDWAPLEPGQIVWEVLWCSLHSSLITVVVTPQSTVYTVFSNTGNSKYPYFIAHGPWLVATNYINNQKHFRHSKINLSLSSEFPVLFKFLGKSLGSSRVRVNHWIVFKFNGVFLACDQTTIHYPAFITHSGLL